MYKLLQTALIYMHRTSGRIHINIDKQLKLDLLASSEGPDSK